MKKIASAIAFVGLFAVFCISVVKLVGIYSEYKHADITYGNLQQQYVQTVPPVTPNDTAPDAGEATEPDVQNPHAPITVDFDALLSENADIVGWLYCPDTVLHYPVVQGRDNREYLHTDIHGGYLASGTLFVDFRNGAIGEDNNYIIYGHNMKNGSMLSCITNYKKQAYYDEHPLMYYLTPNGDYKIELYAGWLVEADSPVYDPQVPLDTLLTMTKEKSTFTSDISIRNTDTVITLSTCSYEYDDARYILIGKISKL